MLTIAHEAGIQPEQMYVTYILKHRPLRKYDKPKTRQYFMGYLWKQLEEVKPDLLFILGNTAIQSFLGDTAEVKNLRGTIQSIGSYKAVVYYQPLAVRRRPNLKQVFLSDLMLAASLLIDPLFDLPHVIITRSNSYPLIRTASTIAAAMSITILKAVNAFSAESKRRSLSSLSQTIAWPEMFLLYSATCLKSLRKLRHMMWFPTNLPSDIVYLPPVHLQRNLKGVGASSYADYNTLYE